MVTVHPINTADTITATKVIAPLINTAVTTTAMMATVPLTVTAVTITKTRAIQVRIATAATITAAENDMTDEALCALIKEKHPDIKAEVTPVSRLTQDLGLSSFDIMLLIAEIQETQDVKFVLSGDGGLITVSDLGKFIS